jgi:Xaa-Pro dipeptidase
MAIDIAALSAAVRDAGLDGWLFYDFRRSNPIAHRILEIPTNQGFTRRWFYYIPAAPPNGDKAKITPTALISAVEPHVLADLPGKRHVFQTWKDLHSLLGKTLKGASRVAMEYSPNNAIPVCARVDAGTVDLVRSLDIEVVSSADLAQQFEAVLTPGQIASHREASRRILAAKDAILAWIKNQLIADDTTLTEYTIQQRFSDAIRNAGLTFEHDHIVAVNAHAGDPHYEPSASEAFPVRRGDLLLLDFTGRLDNQDDSVIADYTWMTALDDTIPSRAAELFAIICEARDTGLNFIREHVQAHTPVSGCDVDDAVRAVVRAAGYANNFVHRSGHNIGTVVHGNGANLDNLETHDERLLLSNTICSMEPGIYLPDIGVRTEVDVIILHDDIEITGIPAQTSIQTLF